MNGQSGERERHGKRRGGWSRWREEVCDRVIVNGQSGERERHGKRRGGWSRWREEGAAKREEGG